MPGLAADGAALSQSKGADALERLAQCAVAGGHARSARLTHRLHRPTRAIDAVYHRLMHVPPGLVEAASGAEWLLDNHYIVRRAVRLLAEDFPRGFERRLPRLTEGEWRGDPRAYALAREVVDALRAQVDEPAARAQVRGFQRFTSLTIAELWALPALLRLALLERLASAAESILQPIEPREREAPATNNGQPQERDPGEAVAACIRSLHALETADWKTFFEELSVVERELRDDPAQVYARMDFETRDRYRKRVESIAYRSPQTEEVVARTAVQLARESTGRGHHVGYFLVDRGRHQLEARVGNRLSWWRRFARPLRAAPTLTYLGAIAILTTAVEAALLYALVRLGAGSAVSVVGTLLFIVPAITVAVGVVNALVTRLIAPQRLPKMDFDKGIPADCATLVAVPALLTDAREIDALFKSLEIRFLANRDPRLQFALLTDFTDAEAEHREDDAALLTRAIEGVERLNARYGAKGTTPFHFFHRPRRWDERERRWMGWERKRGKLIELNRMLLQSGPSEFAVRIGDPAGLRDIRFVIVLDADTELPRDSARHLVATLAHPLNSAEFDPRSGRVVSGYTVLQPRVEISYASAEASWFARLCSGAVGLDPYVHAVSDAYQDLFGEGIFIGKGIYDVAAFDRSLRGRVPEGALLSHDLFEGVHGRAGLVTDVLLIEDFPAHYLAYMRRLHRWVRGDWQLLPWLRGRVPLEDGSASATTLSFISRWKILDNLRRSLVAPTLVAFLVLAWVGFPGSAAWWTIAALAVLATPSLTDLTGRLAASPWSEAFTTDVRAFGRALCSAAELWLLETIFLAHQAAVMLDAIGRTLARLLYTRRRLLEWTPAAHAARRVGRLSRMGLWREMAAAPMVAAAAAVLIWLLHPATWTAAAPLLVLWAVSPAIADLLSRAIVPATPALSPDEWAQLRRLARRTWAFFETYVTPEDQWLPPDHFQETPVGTVARRTSPTNIGLLLLSTIAAYDLGYRGLLWTALRLQNTFDTLGRMERYRGHFFNWYETTHLEPLAPRYVSAVDSGNLVGAFIGVKQTCLELLDRPVVAVEAWDGLRDTLAVLRDVVDTAAHTHHPPLAALSGHLASVEAGIEKVRERPLAWIAAIVTLLTEAIPRIEEELRAMVTAAPDLETTVLGELRLWTMQVRRHLSRMQRETELFLPWLEVLARAPRLVRDAPDGPLASSWATIASTLGSVPTLRQLSARCAEANGALGALHDALLGMANNGPERGEALAWGRKLAETLAAVPRTAEYIEQRLRDLAAQADALARGTDFSLLYDERRRLLHLGYDVAAAKLDDNHYDLLASEARLASFIAIAKGDVPQEHWLYLGRPIGSVHGRRTLLSWSGTMFEYLMPGLLLREGSDTLLGHTCRIVVSEQIAYAKRRGIPWGISESGYYRLDAQQNYQYRAFGVPTIGFKRGLEDDQVVSPYACLLALPYQPRAVVDNLRRLEQLGMSGRYGLYEAIDFTVARIPAGERYAIVRSFMAHHQGMILAVLDNFLCGAPLVRRFEAEPMSQTADLLLAEQPARDAPIEQTRPAREGAAARRRRTIPLRSWEPPDAARPSVHVLANGRYSLVVTASGGGFSRWGHFAITRASADPTLDECGTRIYVRDRRNGISWTLARDAAAGPASRRVVFHPHMVELHANENGISAHSRIVVAPDADVEIRHVRLVNEGRHRRQLTVMSYAEVVLGDHEAHRRHPAFSKLFVVSEYVRNKNALIFHRRPGLADDETPAFLLHMLLLPSAGARPAGYETAREAFLGRGGTIQSPAAARRTALSGTTGATLDPIMALAANVDIPAHGSRQVAFLTAVASSREEVLELSARFRSLNDLDWTFTLAHKHVESEALAVDLDVEIMPEIQRLLSLLLYPQQASADPTRLARNEQGRSGLWRFALSGDLPILLVRVGESHSSPLLHQLVRAQTWWRRQGVTIDLVVLNEQATGYSNPAAERILRTVANAGAEALLQRPGGIFIINAEQLAERDRTLLLAAARVVLDADGDSLAQQLALLPADPVALPPLVTTALDSYPSTPLTRPADLLHATPFGGFSADGREYVIHLQPYMQTPAPWINVIANPQFGFVVSEAGSGYTWAGNSGENRLTPWNNDPVCDEPGEAVYLRDEETGVIWSPTPAPAPAAEPYIIRHGIGYTTFEHNSHGLQQELCMFAATDDPVKIVRLQLRNLSARARRVTVTYFLEWVLGNTRDSHQQFVIPEFDVDLQTLTARNPWNEAFASGVAFAAASEKLHGFTADRTEFLGRFGSRARPAALTRIGLANSVRAGLDPCAALQVHVDLAPGQLRSVHFMLGQGADRDRALGLVRRYRDPTQVPAALEAVTRGWDDRLGALHVRTPEPGLDLMLNHWLLYQTIASRLWARTGFYQSSGAFGFRDQLQDVLAVIPAMPSACRAHVLESARHQFREGDVLHWWHPPTGAGARTRCSDDLVWLPYVTAQYVAATGDTDVLNEELPFLASEPLRPQERDRYAQFAPGGESGSLYEHCLRALERADSAGPHGLPLFGTGDWNDGMNRVGRQGSGESVWLAWFLCATLHAFAPLCERMGDRPRADELRHRAATLREALETSAWDGRWYRRGYYDDGRPLGSVECHECHIDSIAQSWAVLSGAGDGNRIRLALRAVRDQLVRECDNLIVLLNPPFDHSIQDPGYLRAYPPGIRENGGHYSHAATWVVWAMAKMGQGDLAFQLMNMLLPFAHTRTADMVTRYGVEPYVVAADIYSIAPHTGRGGWTWYTGASGWIHRLGREVILGLRLENGRWRIDPCIPRTWRGFEATVRHGATTFEIRVTNPNGVSRGVARVEFDGTVLDDTLLPAPDDQHVHHVEVTMGRPSVATDDVPAAPERAASLS